MMEEKKGKVAEAQKAVVSGLKRADPAMWHRIIMCILIGFAGLALIGGVVMDFVLERQTQELRHMPVVGIAENAVLPQDQYFIYQVYFDETNHTHYLVSSTSGGVVVSVVPPEQTEEPEDVMRMIHYDPAAYLLEVDQNGRWSFISTSVRENILKKTQTPIAP
jgi:hypothetical protein